MCFPFNNISPCDALLFNPLYRFIFFRFLVAVAVVVVVIVLFVMA